MEAHTRLITHLQLLFAFAMIFRIGTLRLDLDILVQIFVMKHVAEVRKRKNQTTGPRSF
jgi:hypothetical protein